MRRITLILGLAVFCGCGIHPDVRASQFAGGQLGGTDLHAIRQRFIVLAGAGISIGDVPGHRFGDRGR